MLNIKHYYPNLNELVRLTLANFIKDDFTVSILEKENFKIDYKWIEIKEKANFTIASFDASKSLDNKYKLFYYLYNAITDKKFSFDLSGNLNEYSEMFTIAVYKKGNKRDLLFKFYLGLKKRDLKMLAFEKKILIESLNSYTKVKKIILISNFSIFKIEINKKIDFALGNLFLVTHSQVFKIREFNKNRNNLNIKLGEKMEEQIGVGLELQNIEIGFQDFNNLNVGTEIEIENNLKQVVLKIGESSYALADVVFSENRLSLRIKDLL